MTREEALALLYEEIEFLFTKGILDDKGLGRTADIFREVRRVISVGGESVLDQAAVHALSRLGSISAVRGT